MLSNKDKRIARKMMIIQYYNCIANCNSNLTARHFRKVFGQRTVYSIIKTFGLTGTVEDRPRSGRPRLNKEAPLKKKETQTKRLRELPKNESSKTQEPCIDYNVQLFNYIHALYDCQLQHLQMLILQCIHGSEFLKMLSEMVATVLQIRNMNVN
jgi:hypothetical protein